MNELMFQAGVKGMSERSELIPCTKYRVCSCNVLWFSSMFRYHLKRYASVFTGSEFVDWLIERELVRSREEAVEYGHSLMLGRVIAHVSNEHYFHDDQYFYNFVEK